MIFMLLNTIHSVPYITRPSSRAERMGLYLNRASNIDPSLDKIGNGLCGLSVLWLWTSMRAPSCGWPRTAETLVKSRDSTSSGKYVWYLFPLLHLIKFKVNKVHVALEMHLKTFCCKYISCNLRQ